MITERVGDLTTRYPWIGILLIFLVTCASIVSMIVIPMGSSFETEDFLPDMEVSRANIEYNEKFTTTYSFVVLMRSHDDIVTPSGFREMISLSNAMVNSDVYKEWKDRGSQGEYPLSPAAAMYNMHVSYNIGQEIIQLGGFLSGDLEFTRNVSGPLSDFEEGIMSVSPDDTDAITGLTGDLAASMAGRGNLDNVLTFKPKNLTPSGYMASFQDAKDMKSELARMFLFNFSGPEMNGASRNMMSYSQMAAPMLSDIRSSIDVIETLLLDEMLSNASKNSLVDIKIDLEEVMNRAAALLGLIGEKGDPVTLTGTIQSFYTGQYIITNFLTKDFDPASGDFSAEGAIMLVSLNNSLNDMYETDPDRILGIERGLMDIVDEMDLNSDISIHSIASAQLSESISDASNQSMELLLPMALMLVLVILLFIYRNLFDMALNLVALGLAIVWMYGFGSIMGYSSNPMITAVPVLLVGLGIDYGIHLTMRYREEIHKGRKVKMALKAMSGSVGMALLLATFTTVFAFLSNMASPVKLIMQFGVMAAVGILSSFIIMLVFIPSVKVLVDVWRAKRDKPLFRGVREGDCDACQTEKAKKRLTNRVILALTIRAEKHPIIILTVVGLITMGMFAAAMNSEVTFDINDFLPDDLQESRDIDYLMSKFTLGGSGETAIILIKGDIADPDVLRAMDLSMNRTMQLGSPYIMIEGDKPKADFILYEMSEIYSRYFRVYTDSPFINAYPETFNTSTGLPMEGASREEVEVVLNSFYDEFPSSAGGVINREEGYFSMAAISFTIDTEDDSEAWKLYEDLRIIDDPIEEMKENGVDDVSVTGSSILIAAIIDSINVSQITSLVLTIVVSFLVLTLIFYIEERSLFLGGIAVLPVIFCLIWIVGTMYLVEIPLNVMTITVGALTIGLGITYGIHITHRFVEDIKEEEDLFEASRKTVMNTGSALFGAALTTVSGFGLLVFARMPPLQQFGQVTALAIIYSFISSIIVLPVLLMIWAKSRRKWRARKDRGPRGTP